MITTELVTPAPATFHSGEAGCLTESVSIEASSTNGHLVRLSVYGAEAESTPYLEVPAEALQHALDIIHRETNRPHDNNEEVSL